MAMRLFNADETNFTSNGLKFIEPIYCYETRNEKEWYLDIRVPLLFSEYIKQDNIVVVETLEKGKQPFRIKNIIVGQDIKCEAHHIGYDSKVYSVSLSTFINLNPTAALTQLLSDTQSNSFTAYSDISATQTFSVVNSTLYDALLLMAERYNAVLEFDTWQIRLVSSIGSDKGVTVAYGKNLEGAEFEENWDMVCTELQPLGNDGLVGTTIYSTIEYDRPYAKIVSFDTDDLTTLNNLAGAYLSRFEKPRVNYVVKSDIINAGLGDTIKVEARQFEVLTQVISYQYNVKTQRMMKLEFGNYRPTIKNAYGQLREEITQTANRNAQIKIDEVNGEIDLRVRKDEVISSINLTPEEIKIQAERISLEGIITANGNVKIDEDGNIEVNNGIFNGEITALTGSIGRFSITDDDLLYTSGLFEYEYDQSDIVRLQSILAGIISSTDYYDYVYDTNNSGTLTTTDLIQIQNYVVSGTPLPTPRRRVRSVIRIGNDNGDLTTTSVAEDNSVGEQTIINGDKIITNRLTLSDDVIVGGIIQRGQTLSSFFTGVTSNNAKTYYTMFNDGTLEYHGTVDLTFAITTNRGSGAYYSSSANATLTIPSTLPQFIDRFEFNISTFNSSRFFTWNYHEILNFSTCLFGLNATNSISSRVFNCSWTARGRWRT
jgi:phage minor structural protein